MTINIDINLSNQIFNIIVNEIYNGIYREGDILTQKIISEKYGVSKTPVWGAIRALNLQNLEQSMTCKGIKVLKIDRGDIINPLNINLVLNKKIY